MRVVKETDLSTHSKYADIQRWFKGKQGGTGDAVGERGALLPETYGLNQHPFWITETGYRAGVPVEEYLRLRSDA